MSRFRHSFVVSCRAVAPITENESTGMVPPTRPVRPAARNSGRRCQKRQNAVF